MRKRPVLLILSACLFLFFPIEIFWHLSRGVAVSPLDWIISGLLPVVLLLGLIKVNRIGWYTLVAMISLWGIRDLLSFYSAEGSAFSFLMHLGIYILSCSYFINPRIRHLYFDPKLRWWRTKTRYETSLPLVMKHGVDWQYPLLKNISEGGCFIETPQLVNISEKVELSIPLPIPLQVSVVKTLGEVRWVSKNPERPGMGIQFVETAAIQQLAINEYVRREL